MAKETLSLVELDAVSSSQTATGVVEKRYTALNGFDTSLRKDAKLLVFSSTMKKDKKTFGGKSVDFHFFWGIDIPRNKLVQISRSGLSGGMGYEQLPAPGVWKLNEEGTWHILQPAENDPAIASRKSWGISRLLPGAFDYEKRGKILVPKCFVIEVHEVKYLCGRSPVDASASLSVKANDLADCTFKKDLIRMWDGVAYYPTRELVDQVVDAYNQVHSQPFTPEAVAELLHQNKNILLF